LLNNRNLAVVFVVAFAALLACPSASAEDGSKVPSLDFNKDSKEPVIINGDTVEYNEAGKTASANGNVSIIYQDLKVTCRKAIFHSDTKEVIAEGDVILTQDKNYFKGEKVVYNIETKTGTVIKPNVFIDPTFYGGGEKAEKLDKDHYYIKRGFVTTCEREHPHYRVQSKQGFPLAEEEELAELMHFDPGRMLIGKLCQRCLFAEFQSSGPGVPRLAILTFFNCHKEAVIFQPGPVFGAEALKVIHQMRRPGEQLKILISPVENGVFPNDGGAEINPFEREPGTVPQVLQRQQSVLQQQERAYKKGVAGER